MNNQNQIERFEKHLTDCNREGMDKLLAYIRKSDFYTAPASTRFHSCHEGGLLEHSLNVEDRLFDKVNDPIWEDILDGVGRESMTITALLHDICKSNYYSVEMKNKKVYSENGKKMDAAGRYDWETVPGYTVNDTHPMGHGECSVIMLQQFIKLKPIEIYAIRWHMGFTEPKESWNVLTDAIKKYPFILAMHEADLESTYLLEKEE